MLTVAQRSELLDADAQQVAERAGIATESDVVVLVDDAAEVGDERGRAARDRVRDAGRDVVGDGVERRDHQQPVAAEVGVGVDDVDADTAVDQRAVQGVRPVEVA